MRKNVIQLLTKRKNYQIILLHTHKQLKNNLGGKGENEKENYEKELCKKRSICPSDGLPVVCLLFTLAAIAGTGSYKGVQSKSSLHGIIKETA